ncbi:MAG: rRNA small subunit methyltransferase B, partial [Pseudolysinimonas sp.]
LLQGLAAARDVSFLAAERAPHRAVMVEKALRGGAGRWLVVTADSTKPAWGRATADRVLLDAPCTGLGALRRRPEARWRKQPSDVAELTVLQTELLEAAIHALAPGGLLAYVTCSPHLGETRDVVAGALGRHPEITVVDTPAVLAAIATRDLDLAAGAHAQLWPHRHGTDAMFIQLMAKVEA